MAYANQRVAIIGLGREGTALAKFLSQHGAKVTISDMKSEEALRDRIEELKALPIRYVLGAHPDELLDTDIIFVSPGVPRDIPFLLEAQRRGVALSSETRLFFSLCRAPIIGVTGSSGKTTTTSLVGEIMRAAGYRTFVGGNIGSPLIGIVEDIQPLDKVVMELSSFQLEVLDQSPHIAAILNISPDHLDRHQSMDDYVHAKTNIIRFQTEDDYTVLNADQPLTRQLLKECRGQVLLFSRQNQVTAGACLDQQRIIVRLHGDEKRICHTSELQLPGSHNVENALAACAIAVAAGAHSEAIRTGVTSFAGVEHRLELVGEVGGVRYYDDSIATSPQRAVAALNSFSEPIILLAGGREKHLPLGELAELIVEKARSLILFGQAAPVLEEAVANVLQVRRKTDLPMFRSSDLAQAVQTAHRISEAGDVVLLSPAFTSFDLYQDFAERGDHFKALVHELRGFKQ
jgi:UDP-N-acetylmuramoylalanine--D-glutamate ligase